MKHLDKQLKQSLEKESLREPSKDTDDKILNLIAEHKSFESKPNNGRWLPWAVAASLFAVSLYVSTDFSSGVVSKSKLDVALESSMQLELSINQLERSKVSPVVFMEISKLNNQIARIDQNIQSLIKNNLNDPAALILINERVKKLNLMKSLYSSDDTILRI